MIGSIETHHRGAIDGSAVREVTLRRRRIDKPQQTNEPLFCRRGNEELIGKLIQNSTINRKIELVNAI